MTLRRLSTQHRYVWAVIQLLKQPNLSKGTQIFFASTRPPTMPLSNAETAVLEALCSLEGFTLPDEPWSVSAKTGFLVLGINSKQMPLLAKECGKMCARASSARTRLALLGALPAQP